MVRRVSWTLLCMVYVLGAAWWRDGVCFQLRPFHLVPMAECCAQVTLAAVLLVMEQLQEGFHGAEEQCGCSAGGGAHLPT